MLEHVIYAQNHMLCQPCV